MFLRLGSVGWVWGAVLAILSVITTERKIVSGGIGCFRCVSVSGSDPACEDTFHNNHTGQTFFEHPCMSGRKDRAGLFPASACIKLTGTYDDTGEVMTVRGCSLDSGSLTIDTELTRTSSCGAFYFGDRYVRGCVMSCSDSDGCNSSPSLIMAPSLLSLTLLIFTHS